MHRGALGVLAQSATRPSSGQETGDRPGQTADIISSRGRLESKSRLSPPVKL